MPARKAGLDAHLEPGADNLRIGLPVLADLVHEVLRAFEARQAEGEDV